MYYDTEDNLQAFLTVAQVAHSLGLSDRRVYQLIEKRLLPAVRLGRSVRVPRRAWVTWLADQEAQALAAVQEQEGR